MQLETNHYDAGHLTSREVWDDQDGTYTLFDDAGIVISSRPLTAQELAIFQATAAAQQAAATADANATTLRSRAQNAIAANAAYLGIATPTNVQVVAQVQSLTKQASGIIRLLLSQLDSTSGT